MICRITLIISFLTSVLIIIGGGVATRLLPIYLGPFLIYLFSVCMGCIAMLIFTIAIKVLARSEPSTDNTTYTIQDGCRKDDCWCRRKNCWDQEIQRTEDKSNTTFYYIEKDPITIKQTTNPTTTTTTIAILPSDTMSADREGIE